MVVAYRRAYRRVRRGGWLSRTVIHMALFRGSMFLVSTRISMADEVKIRTARTSEQKELEALQLRASLSNPGDREALLTNRYIIELPIKQIESGHVFVVEEAGSIMGFAVLLPREDGNSELDGLFVEPNMWRRGYGRNLVDHCAQVARIQGSGAMYVIANPHAENFYKACRFEMFGTTQTQFGIGWLMRKSL
jgi:N-acetylglutamate synthase-like GNAT family acetyltransferase